MQSINVNESEEECIQVKYGTNRNILLLDAYRQCKNADIRDKIGLPEIEKKTENKYETREVM